MIALRVSMVRSSAAVAAPLERLRWIA